MIDVLVPVLGRPVQAMLRSLEHSTSVPYDVWFICSPGDEERTEECIQTGWNVLVTEWEPGPGDFSRKINWAFSRTSSEWIFQAADDIRFSPGWDTAALQVAQVRRASVIGTNDLHNPGVKQRTHATHLLIRRSYIEERGGTFDGIPGIVFSEEYDHQFVDNELIELAKRRRVWAFAERSIVEHLHPVWGLAEWGPTYEKAFRRTNEDALLFQRRSRMRVGSRRRR